MGSIPEAIGALWPAPRPMHQPRRQMGALAAPWQRPTRVCQATPPPPPLPPAARRALARRRRYRRELPRQRGLPKGRAPFLSPARPLLTQRQPTPHQAPRCRVPTCTARRRRLCPSSPSPPRPAPPEPAAILIRLAWHDAGTYSVEAAKTLPFPKAGGATGSIRFKPEMSHGARTRLRARPCAPAAAAASAGCCRCTQPPLRAPQRVFVRAA